MIVCFVHFWAGDYNFIIDLCIIFIVGNTEGRRREEEGGRRDRVRLRDWHVLAILNYED